jgi:hypothetical protein
MATKILIIAGISIGSVAALFIMGHFLDKKSGEKEHETPQGGERRET